MRFLFPPPPLFLWHRYISYKTLRAASLHLICTHFHKRLQSATGGHSSFLGGLVDTYVGIFLKPLFGL